MAWCVGAVGTQNREVKGEVVAGDGRGAFLEKMTSKLGPKGSVGVSRKAHVLRKREFKAESIACI